MDAALARAFAEGCGVVHRGTVDRSNPWAIGNAVGDGELIRVLPRTYVSPGLNGDPLTMRRAALAYAGETSALSHVTALAQWGLVPDVPAASVPAHVTVGADRRLRTKLTVVIHRRNGFNCEPPEVTLRDGLLVVGLHRALVESWPLLAVDERVTSLMSAVGGRRTTAARLRLEVAGIPNLKDRRSLNRVLAYVEDGCRSWLEIFGCTAVLNDPRLPKALGQVPMKVGSRTIYLDRLFEAELVNLEMDGAQSHGSDEARERDRRRDAALAAMRIVVVRYTYRRLRHDTENVRTELLSVLAIRRRQLRIV